MPSIITDTKPRKKNKSRIDVYVDGSFSFTATLFEGITLKKGSALTEEELMEYKARSSAHEAYDKALSIISYRPRTAKELSRKMQEKGFEPELIEDTVARLEKEKYINDAEYAKMFIESRLRNKPRSRYALIYELGQKGINRNLAESLLTDMDEEEAAWNTIKSRIFQWQTYPPEKFKKKVMNMLKNRGFGYEISRLAYERALEQIENIAGDEDDY